MSAKKKNGLLNPKRDSKQTLLLFRVWIMKICGDLKENKFSIAKLSLFRWN